MKMKKHPVAKKAKSVIKHEPVLHKPVLELGMLASRAESVSHTLELAGSKLESADSAFAGSLENRIVVSSNVSSASECVHKRLPVIFASNTDPMLERDKGAMIFLPESNQEFLDDILRCHKISETVMLPSVVALPRDITENVIVPSEQSIESFLGKYSIPFKIDFKNPSLLAVNAKNGQEIHAALNQSKAVIEKTNETWHKKFHRGESFVELVNVEDAELIIITYGQNSTTIKSVVDAMRNDQEKPVKVGLARIHVLRPWPEESLSQIPANAKIAVIDFVPSLGASGILYTEIKSTLPNKHISSFIAPDRLLSSQEIKEIIIELSKQDAPQKLWLE
ncbi:MAG: hypothetical protein ABIG30_00240 [Candidatus Aenigmatarchaeota archaeon]